MSAHDVGVPADEPVPSALATPKHLVRRPSFWVGIAAPALPSELEV